jgi:hypothetical protein
LAEPGEIRGRQIPSKRREQIAESYYIHECPGMSGLVFLQVQSPGAVLKTTPQIIFVSKAI